MEVKEPYVVVTERIIDSPALATVDDVSNIGCVVVCNRGPKIGYVKGSKDFIETYGEKYRDEEGNLKYRIPNNCHVSLANAYYMSTFAPMVIARSMDEPIVTNKLVLLEGENKAITVSDSSLYFYNGEIADNYYRFPSAISEDDKVYIDGKEYTKSEFVAEGDLLKDGIVVALEGTRGFVSAIPNMDVRIIHSNGNYSTIIGQPNKTTDFGTVLGYFDGVEPGDSIKLEVSNDDSSLFDITLPGGAKYSGLSFTEGATDANTGESIYFADQNFKEYKWIGLNEPSTGVTIGSGEVSLQNVDGTSDSSSLIAAATALEEQELYDIAQCATLGITDIQFVKAFAAIAKANDWFLPFDVPESKKSYASIDNWNNAIGLDSNNNFVFGPFDKNSSFLGFKFSLAPSTLYWERVFANKAVGSEFAPTFGAKNGGVNYTNPSVMLKQDEREKLLSLPMPVNFMIYNPRNSSYTINNNLTHSTKDNVLKEEQNRRLANKIKRDVKPLLEDFKGEYNTLSTRMAVVSRLEYYFRNNIMNMNYAPDDFQIICDKSNNTDEVINANQLAVTVKVRFYRSIKYVIVLNEIYPIGVDFE